MTNWNLNSINFYNFYAPNGDLVKLENLLLKLTLLIEMGISEKMVAVHERLTIPCFSE